MWRTTLPENTRVRSQKKKKIESNGTDKEIKRKKFAR